MPRRTSSPSLLFSLASRSLPLVTALCLGIWSAAPGFNTVRSQLADGFDFPCGKPEGDGYYKARGFWPNGHLGEDWNGRGGGDSDLGDAIYSIGRGVVVLSEDVRVGWGNVVIIRHAYREITGKLEMVDSLYGHLLERKVRVGQVVERGQLVGTMGGNNGMYPVHLHLEVRKNLAIGMNRSKFARDYSNYHSPTAFINAHRRLAADQRRYEVPVNTFAAYGGELTSAQEDVSRSTSPSTYTHKSPSARPGPGGVIRTGRGLRIPVVGGGASAPGTPIQRPPVPTTPAPAGGTPPPGSPTPAPAPAPAPAAPEKSDFWSRLKSKLNSGQVTPGMDEKK